MRAPRTALLLVALAGFGALTTASAQAATITVTQTDDPAGGGCVPGAATCSLRQAIAAAQPGDTIQLAGTPAAPVTYLPTQGATLAISKPLTIQGGGPTATIISGFENRTAGEFPQIPRTFRVSADAVAITDLALIYSGDGADEVHCSGPCSTVSLNGGGVIFNTGDLTVARVSMSLQAASTPLGGGISSTGTLHVEDSTFDGLLGYIGGALAVKGGTATVERSLFTGNQGNIGGTIWASTGAHLTVRNSTIVGGGQASARGGGITNDNGTVLIDSSTLAGNLRGSLMTAGSAAVTSVRNTILASGFDDGADFDCVAAGQGGGTTGTSVAAITHDLGHNLDQDDACGLVAVSSVKGADPKLGDLASNGGPTQTRALLAGSPAIGAGALAADCPAADQRGFLRSDGACDIGAFEAGAAPAPTPTPTPQPTPEATPAPTATPAPAAGGSTQSGGTTTSTLAAKIKLPGLKKASTITLKRGYTLSVADLQPGSTVGVKVLHGKVLIRKLPSVKASSKGQASVKLKLTAAQLKGLSGKTLTLRYSLVGTDGKPQTITTTFKVG